MEKEKNDPKKEKAERAEKREEPQDPVADRADGPGKEPEVPAEDPALAEAKAAAEDYKRKWYSVTAEYENYRRRTKGESTKRYNEGRADVVCKLFPIADNLERALKSCESEATKKGIELVVKAFGKILEEEQIETIDPAGEPFDAEKHEAIMAVEPAEGEESGTVREVYRKGYAQNGKVLRFAQVVVVK